MKHVIVDHHDSGVDVHGPYDTQEEAVAGMERFLEVNPDISEEDVTVEPMLDPV